MNVNKEALCFEKPFIDLISFISHNRMHHYASTKIKKCFSYLNLGCFKNDEDYDDDNMFYVYFERTCLIII